MSESVSNRPATGLCAACDHAPSCALAAPDRRPIWMCEEYDDRAGPRRLGFELATPVAPPPARRAAPAGLCGDCVLLPTCQLPKSPTGIWRCEEYL